MKTNKLAPGGAGKGSALAEPRTPEVAAKYTKPRAEHLTWVTGTPRRDNTSRKILAAGRKPAFLPNQDLPEDTQRKLGGYMANGAVVDRAEGTTGTSIFDPVLCELAYKWFCPPGGSILDPFAGGSVRGIVAAMLGYQYTGIDLRPEQVAANEEQARQIVPQNLPRWIVGDSRDVQTLASGEYDFIFSCPPYGNLEVYSDDPRDLSTIPYAQFLADYRSIIAASVSLLKQNRFACFCVGDFRDSHGYYRNFISETIRAFQDAGMMLYNEGILVTAVGSLPIRIGRQFGSYRKLGKTHQNVLVFYRGDIKAIPQEFGEIEVADLGGEDT